MIQFRRWREHNGRTVADIEKKRGARNGRVDAPVSLYRISLSTHLDQQFETFAGLVGGAVAETLFVRAMQYAAEHDGRNGTIRVPREKWGSLVLSKTWNAVPKSLGCKVYDALLESTICIKTVSPAVSPAAPPAVAPAVSPAVAHSAVVVAGASASPPSPSLGESNSPSAQDDAHALRPRERERFARVVEYLVRCGRTQDEIQRGLDLRRRFRTEGVPDEEIEALLNRDFVWVTREKLARFMDTPERAVREAPDAPAQVTTPKPAPILPPGVAMTGGYVPNGAGTKPSATAEIVEAEKARMRALFARPQPADQPQGEAGSEGVR